MSTILTTQQAADLAGVDRETIIRAAKDGRLPHEHKFGIYAFLERDVRRTFAPSPQPPAPGPRASEPVAELVEAVELTAKQALALYNEITGQDIGTPYQVSEGMRRRGYKIDRDPASGRLQIKAADVRAYAKDKLERPRLPSPSPSTTPRGVLTPASARILYNELTGEELVNPGSVVTGMERRGFSVRRDRHGRITMTEADVRAYAKDKLERPNLRKTGKGITISPPSTAKNGRARSTIEAVAEIAENQGYRVIQRRGYVELVRSRRFRAIEPEFIETDFAAGVQAQW